MSQFYLHKLRRNGLKLTPRRRAIIDFFLSQKQYLTPEAVWEGLRKKFAHLGLPGIYRNLELFSQVGLLTKIQRPDRRLYYALCSSGNKHHHHIVCVKCNKVGEFSGCDLPHRETSQEFKIVNHSLQIEGVCLSCEQDISI